MSKIQKALRKMQIARQRLKMDTSRESSNSDTQKLATVTQRILEKKQIPAFRGDLQVSPGQYQKLARFAVVDRRALRAAGLIAPEHEERVLADEYRQIKRPLIANAFGKRATKVESGRLILVTSPLSGDGKTFTCINLALSLAQEKDHTVLLIDADVAKPHISELFNLQDNNGLLDLVEDPSLKLEDVMVQTDVERLTILPAGKSRNQATELLASQRMELLIQSLIDENPHRIILFDSSPILVTSEARVLAGLAGQIVVIVKAGATPQGAIEEAVSTLDSNKAINLVLNQVRKKDLSGYWGSYHGYGSAYAPYSQDTPDGDNKNEK